MNKFGRFLNGNRFMLHVHENPLICNCDYYVMDGIIMMTALSQHYRIQKCAQEDSNLIANCPSVQEIRPRNGCFSMLDLEGRPFRCLKYELRWRGDSIVVRTNISRKFILLVTDFRADRQYGHKCRGQPLSRNGFRCFILYGATRIRKDWQFNRSNFIFVNVMFAHMGKIHVSPLHLMTLRTSGIAWESGVSHSRLFITACAVVGILIGFLTTIWWSWRSSVNRTSSQSASDNNSDIFYY